jgi:probable lipoprotein NlpC
MIQGSRFLHRYKFAVFLFLFLVSGCASQRIPELTTPYKESLPGRPDVSIKDAEVEKKIREEFKYWSGTRHKLGGNDTRGVDCSGLVKVFYKKLFNIDLPRTARTMSREGVPVNAKDLRSGDLVFFRLSDYSYHVGIFLKNGEFLHSTKINGVIISSIGQEYWSRSYWTARRILSG